MHNAEPSAKSDRNLRPHERFQEVAAILAGGLLRLKTQRFALPQPSNSEAENEQISSQKPLELTLEKRRHVLPPSH
jgi:hypothetical protein